MYFSIKRKMGKNKQKKKYEGFTQIVKTEDFSIWDSKRWASATSHGILDRK